MGGGKVTISLAPSKILFLNWKRNYKHRAHSKYVYSEVPRLLSDYPSYKELMVFLLRNVTTLGRTQQDTSGLSSQMMGRTRTKHISESEKCQPCSLRHGLTHCPCLPSKHLQVTLGCRKTSRSRFRSHSAHLERR